MVRRRTGDPRGLAFVVATLLLAACSTLPTLPAPIPAVASQPAGRPDPDPGPPRPAPSPSSLSGWDQENHLAAFKAYVDGCGASRDNAGAGLCGHAREMDAGRRPVTPSEARDFFETRFVVVAAVTADGGDGLLTAYFAPDYPARRAFEGEFDAPVLARPADLERIDGVVVQRRADGAVGPYPDRAAIEAGPPTAPVLAWMRAEDLFFLQIQGSGYLTFEDGGPNEWRVRAAYAADNGRPFAGIARPMEAQGLLPPNATSGEAIRAWLADHRGLEARAVMALNPRYIFFELQPDDGEPAGAAGIPVTARRTIAVDPASWTYGDLVWIEADGGNLRGARASYRGLVMALDTGSAIRGPVRADLYLGRGDAAGLEAGAVRHPLRMWRLVPR